MGSATAEAGQRPPMDGPGAQRTVREAEDLVQGYWLEISPLYLSQHDLHQY
jgi:hypothetical protein